VTEPRAGTLPERVTTSSFAPYDERFYAELDDDVRTSAEVVVPILLRLLGPASVLDVGCGRGTWLAACIERGVDDVVGVDGPHLARAELEIPAARFVAHDLREPLELGRRFDLALSLEVAEHLDDASGDALVDALVAHAPVVLFSAAVPFQGGAGHVNERWQSDWARRFAARGYAAVDAIRPRVWIDDRVAFYYAQNAVLYMEPALTVARDLEPVDDVAQLDVVHPALHALLHAPRAASAPVSTRRRGVARVTHAARAARRRAARWAQARR